MPKIPECDRCRFRAHRQPIICAVHPAGPEDNTCLDFEFDPNGHYEYLLWIRDKRCSRDVVLEDTYDSVGKKPKHIYSIGRHPDCDIRLYSPFVSRRHATLFRIQREDGISYYRIVDGDAKGKRSTNGLVINGCKLQSHNLQSGDVITFGSQVTVIYCIRNWLGGVLEPLRAL